MTTPRIAFMGTPDFALPALLALAEANVEIACVYTQPPRKAGRGQRVRPSPVQQTAERLGLDIRTPESLRDEATLKAFDELRLDLAVVAAYGLILPPAMLDAPRRGCFNIHASLLPRWRGAAPIQHAILAGDEETGVTIMKIDAGLDTGPVLLAEGVPLAPSATAGGLHDELAPIGARLIVDAVLTESLSPRPQSADGVTYAAKLGRADSRIDWSSPASHIERMVRAFNPWPGAWCELADRRLALHEARVAPATGPAGEVIGGPLIVACGEGALELRRVQMSGRSAMSSEEFIRGHPVPVGTTLK